MKIFANKKKKRGFTLIELLVVIAVIGMLSSIVLVSLGPVRKKARDARRVSDIRQISLAMEMCYEDAACGGSDAAYQLIAVDASSRLTTTSISTYMNPLPLEPGGGTATCAAAGAGEVVAGGYCGFASSAGSDYCIWAKLNDGRFFAASEKGAQYMTAAPTSYTACP